MKKQLELNLTNQNSISQTIESYQTFIKETNEAYSATIQCYMQLTKGKKCSQVLAENLLKRLNTLQEEHYERLKPFELQR